MGHWIIIPQYERVIEPMRKKIGTGKYDVARLLLSKAHWRAPKRSTGTVAGSPVCTKGGAKCYKRVVPNRLSEIQESGTTYG